MKLPSSGKPNRWATNSFPWNRTLHNELTYRRDSLEEVSGLRFRRCKQACVPKAFCIPHPNLQPRESEIVDAVLQSEKPIRGEPVESCKLRYFNSFEFFDHTPNQDNSATDYER